MRPAAITIVLAFATITRAGDELFDGRATDDLLTPPQDQYTIRFEPAALYGAPSGDLRLAGTPAGAADADLSDFDLDKPRLSPYAELHYRTGDWRITATGFYVALDDVTTTASTASQLGPLSIAPNDRVTGSVDVAMGELLAAGQTGWLDRFNGDKNPDFALAIEAFGGVRFYHVSFDFAAPAGTVSASEFFIFPLGGAKLTMNVLERFDIDLQLAVGGLPTGGDRSSLMVEVVNGYTYRPTENIGVQIGYRLSFYSLESGSGASEFEYTGAVAGVFAGLVVRF